MSQNNILFEDVFNVRDIDKDVKVFEKVARVEGTTEDSGCEIAIDVNSEIYPMNRGASYSLLITKSLTDGSAQESNNFDYNLYLKNNIYMKKYDYITYGKIFKYTEEPNDKVTIYTSFGGLLFSITGAANQLENFKMDERIYLMLKVKSE